jgi:hypothetical protein
LSEVARAVAGGNAPDEEKFTIFYWSPSGCDGYRAFSGGVSPATPQSFSYYVKGAGAAGSEKQCNGTSLPLAFSYMSTEVALCDGQAKAEDIGDFPAPIQSISVVAHKSSHEDKISAEALHYIFGYGKAGQVSPWTVGNGVFQRDATSFVHTIFARHIEVPEAKFWWTDNAPSNGTLAGIASYVAANGDPDETLSYLQSSNADRARNQVKPLAFQAIGQKWALLPDSDEQALDKLNVRKGNYALWWPGHFYSKVASGKPVDAKVAKLIGWFNGTELAPGNVNITRSIIDAGDIPRCAMEAARDTTFGPVYSYAPPKPCGCYFESIAAGVAPESCVTCSADSECSADGEKCNFGFCEAYRDVGQPEG